LKTLDYYEILGIPQEASADEIKNRYKALALKFHPDKESSHLAREAMVLINKAYEVLSDIKMRAEYDTSLVEPPKDTYCNASPQAARAGPHLGKISRWRVPALVAIALSIACLAGYYIESLPAHNSISAQFMKTNHHYYTAILHEALTSLPLCIPVFGIAWGVLATFTAGFVDKAVIMMPGLSAKVSGLVISYAILATMIKLTACYVGMCRSLTLANSIRKRKFSKLDGTFTLGDIILVVLLSSLVGFVEHAMVTAS